MQSWARGWAFALVCVMAGVCQAQTRELSLRLIEAPTAATTQPAQRQMPMEELSDGKVLKELRLTIECGHEFDVSVAVNGEVWHFSGMAQASEQATDQTYRVIANMELRSENGVESFSTSQLAQHGKDAAMSELVGGGRSRQWVLRIDDPPAAKNEAAR